MAKKGKLLIALDAHKGRDYKLVKQMRLQKQAAKKKRAKAKRPDWEGKGNVEARPSATAPVHEVQSDSWDSDESEAAQYTFVCRAPTIPIIHLTLTRP